MKLAVLVVLVTLLTAACGGGSSAPVFEIEGYVHAGPTCPVVVESVDLDCSDRPVAGARLVVRDAADRPVFDTTSDGDGTFTLTLPAGDYVLVPQPVDGLLGTAAQQAFTVGPGAPQLDVAYDTGIR